MHRITGSHPIRLALAFLTALVAVVGVGVYAAKAPGGHASAAPVKAQVLSTTDRGLCIQNGTGKPQSLWLVAATGDCPTGFWGPASLKDAFGVDVDALVKAEVAKQVAARTVTTPETKRSTTVTVNVDYGTKGLVSVTGLPAWKAGAPELVGNNAGEIADAAADIEVVQVDSRETACPDAIPTAPGKQSTVGSTVRKFCVYPRHVSSVLPADGATPVSATTFVPGFLAGQSFKLNVWVYAP